MPTPAKAKESLTYHTEDPALRFSIDKDIIEETVKAANIAILAGADPELARRSVAISILEGNGTPHGINRDTKQDISAKRNQEVVRQLVPASTPISADKQRMDISSLPLPLQQQLILMDKRGDTIREKLAKFRGKGTGEKYASKVEKVLLDAADIFSNYELRNALSSIKTKQELLTPPRTPTLDKLKK